MAQADAEPPPLLLHGARSEPSALLKVQGSVHCAWGKEVPVQPMIDSGASGMGFVDPAFVQRCGGQVRPSSRRIILADGSEVRAAGEVTLSYSLQAYTCATKEQTPPVRITSTFIVTPLAPYELILGIGWLEQHHAQVGFRERNIQLRWMVWASSTAFDHSHAATTRAQRSVPRSRLLGCSQSPRRACASTRAEAG